MEKHKKVRHVFFEFYCGVGLKEGGGGGGQNCIINITIYSFRRQNSILYDIKITYHF